MEPNSEKMPINVVCERLVAWIKASSRDAMPFESFDIAWAPRPGRKHVERWVFNCNYLYYRFGERMGELGFFDAGPASDPAEAERRYSFFGETFRTIKDSTPLNLLSKRHDAVRREFMRDNPPFLPKSRNALARLRSGADRLAAAYPGFCADRRLEIGAFMAEMEDEASLFERIADAAAANSPRPELNLLRRLLPLWCAKEVNPLHSLLVWRDPVAVATLVDRMADAFMSQLSDFSATEEQVEAWRALTLASQAAYLDCLAWDEDDEALRRRTVCDIDALLTASGFSLDRPVASGEVPGWLQGKARLLWNVVVCALFGPGEAVGEAAPSRRGTRAHVAPHLPAPGPDRLMGEVLLRRRYRDGRMETIDRLVMEEVSSSGLWRVIGSRFDPCAALPADSAFRESYRHLGALFTASEVRGANGEPIEGGGDSRFHMELALRCDGTGRVRLVARDLGSRNGSCVLRREVASLRCFAFPGRAGLEAADWADRLGVAVSDVCLVSELELHRGDVIQLCGSCFEII